MTQLHLTVLEEQKTVTKGNFTDNFGILGYIVIHLLYTICFIYNITKDFLFWIAYRLSKSLAFVLLIRLQIVLLQSELWFPRVSVLGIRNNTVTFLVHRMACHQDLEISCNMLYLWLQCVTIVSVVLYGVTKTYRSLLQSQP